MHKDSDLVPSITKYCHKHIESVLSPITQKKDLRLNWVSVSLWQQFFCWRCTVHRKGTKRTTEKWHLVLLGHKLGRKINQSGLLIYCLLHYLCCLMPHFRCLAFSLGVLGWSTSSPPHWGGYRQAGAESLSIPSQHFCLHPAFPILWNSSAHQDHNTSGRHNYEGVWLVWVYISRAFQGQPSLCNCPCAL